MGALTASERDEFLRAAWKVSVAEGLDPERLVFVDECGVHTSLAPLYGYAPKGKRLRLSMPRNRGKNTTLLSRMTLSGMGPSMAVEDSTTGEVFEAYVEHFLALSLKQGQVVVMDNLNAHKPKRVRKLIEGRGCELLYLPPYSPDLNPIEELFSKVKRLFRPGPNDPQQSLVEAIGKALEVVGAWEARGYFTHCGYRGLEQQL